MFMLKIHHTGDFTTLTERRHRFADIDWFDLVDCEQFLLHELDGILEDLGYKDGRILFTHFRIPDLTKDEDLKKLRGLLLLKWHGSTEARKDGNVVETETQASTSKVYMFVELHQGNDDVVFKNNDQEEEHVVVPVVVQEIDEEVMEREDHIVKENEDEAKAVNGVDESDFHHAEIEIPPTKPEDAQSESIRKTLAFSEAVKPEPKKKTLDLADIYGRFVYEDNLIQIRISNDEVDERTSEEYIRDLDIEYHERALLANSKHFIKRRNNFSSQKANENTECYKCGNKGHFARDCFSKTSEPSYKSPMNNYSLVSKGFQPKFTPKLIQSSSNSNNQADQKFQKDYKAEYKKMKAKLALLECRDELLILKQDKLDAVTFQIQNTELIKLNHALQEQLKEEKKINEKWLTSSKKRPGLGVMKYTKPEIHNSSKESVSGTVTVSESKQTTPSVPTEVKDTEQESKSKPIQKPQLKCELCHYTNHSTDDCYRILYCMKCKREDHRTSDHEIAKEKPFPPCTHYGFNDHMPDDCINYPECRICRSYDHSTSGHNRVIQIRGGVLAESSQSNESSIRRHIREPICYLDSGCSRSMTGVKSYLHKYVEKPGPKVVFGDNSSYITEGYGSINYVGIVFTKVAFVNGLKYNLISISQLCDAKYIVEFDDKQGTIFNANKEIILMAPRRNDVYVLDMSSLTPNGACFFAKASESINWLWHKRLSHLNFKNINKLAKQNKVFGLPSLVYSKDKPCTTCKKEKHHRALFKAKQNFSIRKCLHLLHMDLFGPVSPMSINHEKYTIVIVDEYSRMVENQNDVKFKQIRTDNGTEFRNHELKSFCDEKGISQNFSSPYTPKQNGVAKRRKRTLIEAARTMLNDSDVSYYIIPHGRSLTEITQENHVLKVIAPNEPKIPHTKDDEGPPDQFNTEGTHEQNVQNDQMIIQPTNVPSGNNTKVSRSITEPLVHDVTQSYITNQASISSYPVPQDKWSRNQHIELVNIIGDPGEGMLTKSMDVKLTSASASECLFADFLFEIEPKKVSEALKHPGWIDAMQEELNQFYRNKVWTLVHLLYGKTAIEGIDYDETFAPVARMEAIKMFLAFATYMNFKVYQMDIKSAFLNDKMKEEVYVKQPPGFESSEFPTYVCKLDKALYGLKQALRAWYETLSTFLIQNKFARGRIDNTLFIYKSKGEVLLVQVYVDDIIFSSTSYKLCKQFEKLMTKKFETSMMGEVTYFLDCKSSRITKASQFVKNSTPGTYSRNMKFLIVPHPMCKILVQSKGITSNSCEKNPQTNELSHGCNMDRKSTSGACQILGGKLVCWSAKKLIVSVLLSQLKIKYVVSAGCLCKFPIDEKSISENFLRKFWSTAVTFDPFTSTNKPKKRPFKEFLIKFLVSNGQRPLTLDFKTFCSSTRLDYNNGKYVDHPTPEVLGMNYSSTEQVNSIQQLLAYSLITETKVDIGEIIYSDLDPSKVTDIELTAHMIAVNNQRDLVSPPPLVAKPKKGKSQTVAPTLPKSQGPEASGALSKKRKKPKSKRPPTKTKESPPKPTKGSEQSHSVSSGTIPDPQDLERNIQLASTGLPSTLNEGTRKSQPLPEGTATHP
ncbi:retrovirus-related pol polyprotein from transposon TNT 1-94 [Tanacetum coccineum]|uniref:Retrovirus-related pol polyprotein from transposon TNT 1-94 n=1 Tax=Tanacetum coccineum TaxID=301880 RepID=A0ABQ5GUJ8_9ASTR